MKPNIRFLHGADFHLAPPPEAAVAGKSPAMRCLGERFAALSRFIDAAISRNVDFIVISGDLFDSPEARRGRTVELVLSEFHRLERISQPPIPVFIIHGNHDFGSAADWGVALPEYVKVFSPESPETVTVLKNGRSIARITGQSYASRRENRAMHRIYSVPDRSLFNIALLHTDLGGTGSRDVPATLAELAARNDYDYWALGHEHTAQVLSTPEKDPSAACVAFSGMLQGGDIGDTGHHGALMVSLESGRAPRIEFLPLSGFVWLERDLNISPLAGNPSASFDDILRLIKEDAEKLRNNPTPPPLPSSSATSSEYIVRWRMIGRAEVHDTTLRKYLVEETDYPLRKVNEVLAATKEITACEISLATASPRPSLEELLETPSGRFFKALREASEELKKELIREENPSPLFAELFGSRAAFEPDVEEIDGDWRDTGAFKTIPFSTRRVEELLQEALDRAVDAVHAKRSEMVNRED